MAQQTRQYKVGAHLLSLISVARTVESIAKNAPACPTWVLIDRARCARMAELCPSTVSALLSTVSVCHAYADRNRPRPCRRGQMREVDSSLCGSCALTTHMRHVLTRHLAVLLGEAGVGKTNLLTQFVKGEFIDGQESTIGGTGLA